MYLSYGNADLSTIAKMHPRAIVPMDFRIDAKALSQMAEHEIPVCMPVSALVSSYGIQRSKKLYLAGKTIRYAVKAGVRATVASLAESNNFLCSYMQMIEIAKLIGLREEAARKGLSSINRLLVQK